MERERSLATRSSTCLVYVFFSLPILANLVFFLTSYWSVMVTFILDITCTLLHLTVSSSDIAIKKWVDCLSEIVFLNYGLVVVVDFYFGEFRKCWEIVHGECLEWERNWTLLILLRQSNRLNKSLLPSRWTFYSPPMWFSNDLGLEIPLLCALSISFSVRHKEILCRIPRLTCIKGKFIVLTFLMQTICCSSSICIYPYILDLVVQFISEFYLIFRVNFWNNLITIRPIPQDVSFHYI